MDIKEMKAMVYDLIVKQTAHRQESDRIGQEISRISGEISQAEAEAQKAEAQEA